MKYISYIRAFGAVAIGLSGAASIFGYTDVASVLMLFGTAAATPGSISSST